MISVSTIPASRLLPKAYRPLFAQPDFRRLLSALAVSDLGDGMSVVAVVWLAVRIGGSGSLIGAAVAAYVLPGAVGALLLGRWLRRLPAAWLMAADGCVHAVFLGCVPLAWAMGVLHPVLYVSLLAGSSVLHAWGRAGTFAVVAEVLPPDRRPAGNALVSTSAWASTIVGPALAGVLAGMVAPAWLIGLDALSFAALAVQSARLAGRSGDGSSAADVDAEALAADGTEPIRRSLPRLLLRSPELLGLIAVTWLFNLCYGPVEVALPLFVIRDLHASASVLGLYWAVFGIGAVVGASAVGALRRRPLWPVMLGIVAGHGLAMLSFGPRAPVLVSLAGFAVGGLIYGPYNALSLSLFQDRTPAAWMTTVLALRGAVLLTAAPLGTALGGPLSAVFGPRQVLVGTGLAMILLACAAAALRARTPRTPEAVGA